MTIAVDFDGTIVEHKYPQIGNEIPFATDTLKMLIADGHRVILWTVREGGLLDDAVRWLEERGVHLYCVNKDFPEENADAYKEHSRKLKVDIFIDDRNVGGLPSWGEIYQMISQQKTYEALVNERVSTTFDSAPSDAPKKKWWQF